MTTPEKINNSLRKTNRILLAPLDWGLGHATRCIPIIKELLNQKCEVWIAASGAQRTLLEEEFPSLPFVEIPGYNIKYGKNRAFTLLKIVGAIPKILIRIKREKSWLRQFLTTQEFDAVISDNRYGLHAPGIFSVFITHQLHIRTPFGRMTDALLQRLNYRAIQRFSLCWIPDQEGAGSLAGGLSHPDRLPVIPLRYIGILSRFERSPAGQVLSSPSGLLSGQATAPPSMYAAPCDLLILLSGPEPQRTIFEKKILDQLPSYPGNTILVRGLPGSAASLLSPAATAISASLRVYNHLPAGELNTVLNGAEIVLARTGYSTVMDLLKLGKKAILVPTPGQTEQEYLGAWLSEKKMVVHMEQSAFSLLDAMAIARDYPFADIRTRESDIRINEPGSRNTLLQKEIHSFLEVLSNPRD